MSTSLCVCVYMMNQDRPLSSAPCVFIMSLPEKLSTSCDPRVFMDTNRVQLDAVMQRVGGSCAGLEGEDGCVIVEAQEIRGISLKDR